jgi:hypothetical protein
MKSIHLFSTIIDYSILRTIHQLEVFENDSNTPYIQSMSYSNGDVNIAQATVLLNFLKTLNKKEVIKMNPLKNDSMSFYSVKEVLLNNPKINEDKIFTFLRNTLNEFNVNWL